MGNEVEIAKLLIEYAPNISTNAILLGACGYLFWANKQLLKEFKSISALIVKNANTLEQMEMKRNQAREHNQILNQAIKDEIKELKFELRQHTQTEALSKNNFNNNSYLFNEYGEPFTRKGHKNNYKDFDKDYSDDYR